MGKDKIDRWEIVKELVQVQKDILEEGRKWNEEVQKHGRGHFDWNNPKCQVCLDERVHEPEQCFLCPNSITDKEWKQWLSI